jgi:aminopeptidase
MTGTPKSAEEFLRALPFDEALAPGAHNAVVQCLRIQPEEKVTLITDHACAEIGAALAHELDAHELRYNAWILEDLAPRPLQDMPPEVLDDMESSQVSIFAVKAQANELRTRMQMTDVVNRRQIRHAHMVNIDRRIMLEGMRADFAEVDRISTQVWQMASAAKEIRATNPAGTEILGHFSPQLKWLKTSGIISPHKWGNLPGGETFTSPANVEGTFVIDGVVGDYLCE